MAAEVCREDFRAPNHRFSHENEFYREAVVFARYQPGTFTLENAVSYAQAQDFYDSRS